MMPKPWVGLSQMPCAGMDGYLQAYFSLSPRRERLSRSRDCRCQRGAKCGQETGRKLKELGSVKA